METAPWYTSAIVRHSIVQILTGLAVVCGVQLGDLDLDKTLATIGAGIASVVGLVTLVTRILKPAPNLSARAVNKEIELVAAGKIPPSPTGPSETAEGV